MDFSERKCSGDGLGTNNGPVISLKRVANSILNLSVFHLVPRSFGGRKDIQAEVDRQTYRLTDRQTDKLMDRQTDEAA